MHARIVELLDYLEGQRRGLRTAFDGVRPALREQSPGPGQWSIANIVEHLALVENRLAGRLTTRLAEAREEGAPLETSVDPILGTLDLSALANRTAKRTAPEPVQPTGLSAHAAWQALDKASAALRRAIAEGDGLALGAISMPHPVFGPISLYHHIAIAGAHEARHAEQIREVGRTLATSI